MIVTLWLFAGSISSFWMLVFADAYLPSPDWVEKVRPYAHGLATLFSVAWVWHIPIMVDLDRHLPPHKRPDWFQYAVYLFFGPVMANFIRLQVVNFAGPAALGFSFGNRMWQEHTVVSASLRTKGKCPRFLSVEGRAQGYDTCRMPIEINRQLKPGQRVEFTGRGTSMGMFIDGVRMLQQP
ncbi:hypothetical protein [Gemmobacter serpentinus]|uniref:hypothetical protein n=1 Tax=Gemmobacter serpentinus TaxID=2652247 RepID=UPI00124D3471|nr:hypothetical protein [Gemmobacter serpentinus]